MKQKRGFTLIELIVVLAILAIVAAIAVPTAFGSIRRAENTAAIASIKNIESTGRMVAGLAKLEKNFGKGDIFIKYNDADGWTANKENGTLTAEGITFFKDGFQKAGISVPKNTVITLAGNMKGNNETDFLIISYIPGDMKNVTFFYSAPGMVEKESGYYRYEGDNMEKIG